MSRQEHRPEVEAARRARAAELAAEEAEAEKHPCPVCGAGPGEACDSPDGTAHIAREQP